MRDLDELQHMKSFALATEGEQFHDVYRCGPAIA